MGESFNSGKTSFENFTNMSIMARTFHETMKQSVELYDSYLEIMDTCFKSLKNLYLRWMEKEEEKAISCAFFMTHNMQKEFDKIGANKETTEKYKDKDRKFFEMYF